MGAVFNSSATKSSLCQNYAQLLILYSYYIIINMLLTDFSLIERALETEGRGGGGGGERERGERERERERERLLV